MTNRVKGSGFRVQDTFGYVSLLDIAGASSDGTTDNTAALNTALALNLPLFIPAGVFITGPISVPANSRIFGYGTLKLKAASTSSLLSIGSGTSIDSVTLDGNKGNVTGTCHGIAITNAVATSITGVKIQNTLSDGVSITGTATDGVGVRNCDITGFTRNGITWTEGNDVRILGCNIYLSDSVASPGDGIAVVSTGNTASNGKIADCTSKSNVGRGFAFVGSGSKNVTAVTVASCTAKSNTGNGFHLLTAQRIFMTNCLSVGNSIDGFRIEGDTQNCRLSESGAFTNTSYGIREVTTGATPNLNGFIYNIATGNGTDTITKVGASSFIV